LEARDITINRPNLCPERSIRVLIVILSVVDVFDPRLSNGTSECRTFAKNVKVEIAFGKSGRND
jgi:hypothetical protein